MSQITTQLLLDDWEERCVHPQNQRQLEEMEQKEVVRKRKIVLYVCKNCGLEKARKKPSSKEIFCSNTCYFETRKKQDVKEYMRKWRNKNRLRVRAYGAKWYGENRKTVIASSVKRRAQRYRTDHVFSITCRLRSRLVEMVRISKTRKSASFHELVGCDSIELAAHIESTFVNGMNWKNRSKWHVDHRIPCSKFDLSNPEEQRRCFHYSNLQALWGGDNIRKYNK